MCRVVCDGPRIAASGQSHTRSVMYQSGVVASQCEEWYDMGQRYQPLDLQ